MKPPRIDLKEEVLRLLLSSGLKEDSLTVGEGKEPKKRNPYLGKKKKVSEYEKAGEVR